MSQAFAKIPGGENVEACSAGSKPTGIVKPQSHCSHERTGLRFKYPRQQKFG